MKLFGLPGFVGAATLGALVLAGAPAVSAQSAASLKANGLANLESGNLQGAVDEFTAAISLTPGDATLFANRAAAKTGQSNYGGAVEDYTQVIKLKPKEANGYLLRALASLFQGNVAGAAQDCDKALELDPKDPTLYLYRGIIADCDNNQQGAVDAFGKAIDLGAKSAPLTANYAQLYRAFDLRRQGPDAPLQLEDSEKWQSAWTKTIAGYLSGKVNDAGLLSRAGASAADEKSQKREKAEAYYFTGRMHVINGDNPGAKAAFQASFDLQYPADVQRRLAQVELDRLNATH